MMRWAHSILPLGIAVLALSGCQSPQAKEASYLNKGKKEFQKKHFDVAIIHFKNAMAAQPNDAEPYYQLGLAYLASNEVSVAASYFMKATQLNPKHPEAQLRLSALMAATSNQTMVQEAQKRTEGVLALQPDNADALNLLAFTELRLGKPESAEAHLEQVLRGTPGNLRSSVALAQTRLARHDVAGAEEALKQAVSQAPKSPDPLVYLGGFYVALAKTAEAEQQFRHALEIDPKHASALIALGAMQVRAGQSDQAEQTYRQLSDLPDKSYKPLHALFLFQSGKRDQALAEFDKLAKDDPADHVARTRLVTVYLAMNRVPDAEKVLTAALKKDPRDIDALMQRSQIFLGQTKYDQAESDLHQVLRVRNDEAQAHYLLAKLDQARGQTALRKQELGEALRLDPKLANARVELAQMLITSRAADSALQTLDQAPAAQKGTPIILSQRNWALLALGQKPEARKGIDQALALSRSPDALLQDAVLKLGEKDYSGARASTEEILKKDPGNAHALNLLVLTYAAQKQIPAGVQKAREYAAKQPSSAAMQQYLGQLLSESGDRAGARKAFDAAKTANPALVEADLGLAQLDAAEGKQQDAQKRLTGVVSSHPDNEGARLLLAQVEMGEGASAEAIDQYRKVLAQDGKNASALNNLAYLLADANQADEALKYAQAAKEVEPDSAAVDDTLGWTYYRKGLYSMAVTSLESATAREATARRKYHLAMAYLKAGNPTRGRQVLAEAMKMDPKLPEANTASQLFGTAKP